jgi:hypothetical protein
MVLSIPQILALALAIRVGTATIAPSKMKCHAIEVRMGMIIRYAAETALPLVHAIQMEIIVIAIAIVCTDMRALTVSLATNLRALVMELYLSTPMISPCAPVIRVTRSLIASKK